MSGERKTPFLGRKRLVYPEEVLARSVIARKLYLGWKKNLFPRVFFLRSRGTCEGRIVGRLASTRRPMNSRIVCFEFCCMDLKSGVI